MQFLKSLGLVLEQTLAGPHTLKAKDGFAKLSAFQPVVAELKREGLERDQLRDISHAGEFLVYHGHRGLVVSELQQGMELIDDGSPAYIWTESGFQTSVVVRRLAVFLF